MQNCFLEIDNCKLGNGGCDGRYQLMDGLLVNFRHSPSGLAQELFINIAQESSSPLLDLNGPHKILERQKNSMKMSGKINLKPTPPNTLYKIVEIDMQLSK
ncbi:MAG: hypothetical protein KA313_08185 [Pseudarcicella sp.]|nr:hypothetical protein [Pseudarcicella sp.]MBP6411060.1 hypothetical protein [Pseudarcicella sp.]